MFKDLAPLSTHENYQLDPGRGILLDPRMIIINTLLIKFLSDTRLPRYYE